MCCLDFKQQIDTLFEYRKEYQWIIKWIEVTKGKIDTIQKYGTPIKYCPFCGKKLNEKEDK